MTVFFNELSIHGQFNSTNLADFKQSLEFVMKLRRLIKKEGGGELRNYTNLRRANVGEGWNFASAFQHPGLFNTDAIRSIRTWIDRGPFWDDDRSSSSDDYFEVGDVLVTDTSVGEAAHRALNADHQSDLVLSLSPSDWALETRKPIYVLAHLAKEIHEVTVTNLWDESDLINALRQIRKPLKSWKELEETSKSDFSQLIFSKDCFDPLKNRAFQSSTSEGIYNRLSVLNKLVDVTSDSGERTPDGNDLYQKHFVGSRAWFSDSSDQEKQQFRTQLTFSHPDRPGETMFCTMHGKINSETFPIRIHFSWPEKPRYVVFVGPKITAT